MRQTRVWVSGAGCVSALGVGLEATLAGLRQGEDPSREVDIFDIAGCRGRRAALLADPEVAGVGQRHRSAQKWHRVTRMLWLALEEALQGCPGFQPEAAIFGTTSGGMSYGEAFYRALREGDALENFRRGVREYPPQQAANQVLRDRGWGVAPWIISNACASGSNAVGLGWEMVASGRAQRVICGGYDALSQLVFCGFDALKALSPDRCRPFDEDRSGLVLGEGAAVLLLESEEAREASGAVPLGELCGYGSVTDNHHLTQPEPGGSGPRGAMEAALRAAGIGAAEVDYINAHGTATPLNDASEGRAIAGVCPEAWVSSTKGLTGHTLGAAGAIEAVICLLAMREGFLPENVNWRSPDPDLSLRLVGKETGPTTARIALSNSFGFGGSNATVVLRHSC